MNYQAINKCNRFGVFFLALALLTSSSEAVCGQDSAVVNIAYGKQNKDLMTSSAVVASGHDLRKSQVATLSNAFFGRIPGMSVIQTDGEPGYDEATLYLRGQHSFRSNSFIILLDGFPIDGFNQVSAEEIESVTYLRDAASLAVYGMNGANGVLLITSKRGGSANDGMKISLKARYGIQTPTYIPKFEGSYSYAQLYNEALRNDGLPELYSAHDLQAYQSGTDPYYHPT